MSKSRIILLAAFAIIVLAVVGIGRWLRPYDLNTERAAARAAGIPLSPAEFRQTPIPDAQNAAVEYTALGALLKQRPMNQDAAVYRTENVPGGNTGQLRAELRSQADVAALIHRAAAKPALYRPHTWSPDEKFPYYATMREAAKWMRSESLLLAADGRPLEAVRHQALGLNIARQAGMDPPLIGYLVSLSIEQISLKGMASILRSAGPNADVANAVRAALTSYHPTYDLARSLTAETMMGLTVIAQVRESSADTYARQRGGPPRDNPYVSKFWIKPNEAVYLHWMTGKIVAARLPEPQRLAALTENDDAMNRELGGGLAKSPAFFIAAILAPVAAKVEERRLQAAAQRAVVTSAAAVLEYRARNGKYPPSLDHAISPPPIDPLTSNRLEYQLAKTGFTVSAHPNVTGLGAARAKSLIDSLQFSYPMKPRPPTNPNAH